MRCDEARQRLNEAFDHGRDFTDDIPLGKHLQACAECTALAKPLQQCREDLAAARYHDTEGGLDPADLRAEVEARVARRAHSQTQENSIMAALKKQILRPRFGLGLAVITAALLVAIVIPFGFRDATVGYEVAFAGVDRNIAMDTERINEFLISIGVDDADIDVSDCEKTCKLQIKSLKDPEEAYLVWTAFNDFSEVKLTGDMIELVQDAEGNVFHVTISPDEASDASNLSRQEAREFIIDIKGKDFNTNSMIWLASDSTGATGITISGHAFELLDGELDKLHDTALQALRDSGITIDRVTTEDGREGMFIGISAEAMLGENGAPSEEEGADAAAKQGTLPDGFELHQNHPNPFNPNTTISFSLPAAEHVKLDIYNVNGQVVRTLIDRNMPDGTHTVEWDSTDETGNPVASGIYFYRLSAGDKSLTKKMSLVK